MADPHRSAPLAERQQRLVDLDALLDELADRVAERITQRIGKGIPTASGSEYYSANNNPLGSQRAFLDAARRKDFPSFKPGRTVLARREDVDRWIESHPRTRHEPSSDNPTDRDLLERAGVRLKGKGRR
ncbi:MAG: hypothetical protein HUU21_25065 [Polyangiaceae bacterium]|nr:hypothetical protein [Polyangiaceae bacterium]